MPNLSPVKLVHVKADPPDPQYTLERLCEWVSDLEGVSVDHIKSVLRNPQIVKPRMIFYHLAYKHSQGRFSSETIARFVGKDHTSVLSGIKRIAHLRQSDRGLDHRLSQYEEYLVYKTVKSGDNVLCVLCPYR